MADSNDLQKKANDFELPRGAVQYRRSAISTPGCHIYFDRQTPATWPTHQHRQLEITVVFAGADCVATWETVNGRKERHRIVGKGDQVLMMPAGRDHAIEWHKDAEILSLYLETDWAQRIVPQRPTEVAITSLDSYVATAPLIGELAATFQRECGSPRDGVSDVVIETLGPALAAQLLRARFAPLQNRDPLRWTLPSPVLDRICAHIDNNLDQNFSLATLARVVSLSPSYFGQIFRGATGVSPLGYVTLKRVQRAKELLATGNYRVAEVCERVGFGEPHRMNYHFRRLLKSSPSAYLPSHAPKKTRHLI